MSAFIVNPEHIIELAVFLQKSRRKHREFQPIEITLNHAELIANTLNFENYRSVNYRYDDNEQPEKIIISIKDYDNPRVTNPVHILKMADCLAYQSCETDDWYMTSAKEMIDEIRRAAIQELPGYDNAPWAYSE
jgi:hypothetical protein